jgi:nicotinamide-nucleotide amidase
MRAAILSIGSELLRGDIVDTNAAYLARELSQIGFRVERHMTAGDDLAALTETIDDALRVADVVVGTGGLGPTEDDLTREAIAAALKEDLWIDETLVRDVEARFALMRRRMPLRNRKQAALIPSARAIPNPNGTAPGWHVERDGKTIVVMPGPPGEMEPMWRDTVLPRLERLLPGQVSMLALMTFGLGESAVEERIDEVIHWRPEVTVATYAKSSGVQVHVTARADTHDEADSLVGQAEAMLRERLGKAIFGTGDVTLSEAIGEQMARLGATLAVMESATGGTLGSLITNTPGSSSYFLGGVIAYSKEAKARYGVDRDVMERHGLISEETARAMSTAICRELGADVGIGVTGIAGSESVEGKPPGTCYIAVSRGNSTEAREIRRQGQRDFVKRFFAQSALDLARRVLEEQYTAT